MHCFIANAVRANGRVGHVSRVRDAVTVGAPADLETAPLAVAEQISHKHLPKTRPLMARSVVTSPSKTADLRAYAMMERQLKLSVLGRLTDLVSATSKALRPGFSRRAC